MKEDNVAPSFKDFIQIPFNLLKLIGISLIKTPHQETWLQKLLAVLLVANSIIQTLLEIVYILTEPFKSALDGWTLLCCWGYAFQAVLKFYAVFRCRFLLYEIVKEIQRIHPQTREDAIAFRSAKYYIPIRSCLQKLSVYHAAVTIMFNVFPIVQSAVEYITKGGEFVRRFAFFMSYPFDPYTPAVYPFVVLSHMHFTFGLLIFFSSPDYLLVAMVQLICMHLEYLSKKITDFVPKGTDEDLDELESFVRYHQQLLKLSSEINEVFNFASLWNFLVMGALISITAMLLMIGVQFLDLLKFAAFLITSLGHVYLVCHFGTKLLKTSEDISQAVFGHQWYLGNAKYRKMLLLIIRRAQQPACLTAFKFFVITMETFKTLITISYQIFTLLKTSYQDA